MNFREALRDLEGRQPESMPEPSLDRIERIVKLLDDPQLTYPTIHITGTNGKTTTARLVTALACAHGLTTGTFVSPHVRSVTERLSLCGGPISEDEFAEVYTHLAPYFDTVDGFGSRITYFEALAAMAYLWLADKPVSLGVFEVGVGGSWDATNLIRGDVAVICPIGLDHPQLWSTVEEAAADKAGIIKEGRTVVVREQRPEAMDVLRRRADEMAATVLLEGEAFALSSRTPAVGGQTMSVRGLHGDYDDLFLALWGEQSARNAAAAIAALEALLGRKLDDRSVRTSLAATTSPGRLEVVSRTPLVILDGAHNADAAAALVAALAESFTWERLHLVLAMFADKYVEEVVGVLGPLADRVSTARNASPRSAPTERLVRALESAGVTDVEEHATVPSAVHAALEAAGRNDLILVTGSFYTVGDARPLFPHADRSPSTEREDP